MKPAPLKWNKTLTNFFKDMELKELDTGLCIFNNCNSKMQIGIYVDDGLVINW